MNDDIQYRTGPSKHRGHTILSVSVACGVLETIAVVLRFLARKKISARWRADDWIILLSLLLNYTMMIAGGLRGFVAYIIDVERADPDFLTVVVDGKAGNPRSILMY